jgi:hypothetical protein
MLRKIDAAYMAGYFDADGCVSVSLNGSTLSVKVSMSGRNEPLCGQLNVVYGGGIDRSDSGTATWYAYSDNAKKFLIDIRPYLRYKKDQADLSLEVLNGERTAVTRLRAALAVCRLNQENLAEPQTTKTMIRIVEGLRKLGVEVDTQWTQ